MLVSNCFFFFVYQLLPSDAPFFEFGYTVFEVSSSVVGRVYNGLNIDLGKLFGDQDTKVVGEFFEGIVIALPAVSIGSGNEVVRMRCTLKP